MWQQLEKKKCMGKSRHEAKLQAKDQGKKVDGIYSYKTYDAYKQSSINIEPIKFHALRHTYATRLFELDVPPKTVQHLMGHADIETTMNIYTKVMPEQKLKAVEKINNIFK